MAPICQTRDFKSNHFNILGFECCLLFISVKKKGLLVCRVCTSATIITFTIQTNI